MPAENEKIVEERVSQEAFEAVENAEPDEAAGIPVIEEEIETPVIEESRHRSSKRKLRHR